MNLNIRKASVQDMPAVLDLIKELAIFEKEPNAVAITTDDLIANGFGENPLFNCYIALLDNNIVGMAICYFRFSTWKGKTVHLEDLIVKEDKRGLGVGKALYTKVMQFANTNGVKRVEWVVLDWNEPAVKFYESTGANLLKDWYLVQMDEEGLSNFLEKNQ